MFFLPNLFRHWSKSLLLLIHFGYAFGRPLENIEHRPNLDALGALEDADSVLASIAAAGLKDTSQDDMGVLKCSKYDVAPVSQASICTFVIPNLVF